MKGGISKEELNQALNKNLTSYNGVSFLSKSDEDNALDVLADAFKEDPMFAWVAELDDDDPNKTQKMLKLGKSMHAWVNHRLIVGKRGVALGVRSNQDLVGCMSLSPSSCATRTQIWDDVMVMFKFGLPPMYKEKGAYGPHSSKRAEKLEVLTKKRKEHMKGIKRWIYLQTLGVSFDHHGKGHGKKLLQLLIQTADMLNASIYLETESENNEGLYKKFGFQTLEVTTLRAAGDDSPTANLNMWLMRKTPSGGKIE
eukprot:CAMPEP_0196143446 /NCGR_PEP_ID=MMETSP0910-20130528/13381_1 /TAXON_ID=49265 /ORGANISM="Thalassiosira rotula, Strain GSO102" /LENGTH=254 /DNA_ID=CAMNT_0041404907 /DNA_START=17 /DNA_END=781 /DNA_ORIENTATION=-